MGKNFYCKRVNLWGDTRERERVRGNKGPAARPLLSIIKFQYSGIWYNVLKSGAMMGGMQYRFLSGC